MTSWWQGYATATKKQVLLIAFDHACGMVVEECFSWGSVWFVARGLQSASYFARWLPS